MGTEIVMNKINECDVALNNVRAIFKGDSYLNSRIDYIYKGIEETRYNVEHVDELTGTDRDKYLELVFMVCHDLQKNINNLLLKLLIS